MFSFPFNMGEIALHLGCKYEAAWRGRYFLPSPCVASASAPSPPQPLPPTLHLPVPTLTLAPALPLFQPGAWSMCLLRSRPGLVSMAVVTYPAQALGQVLGGGSRGQMVGVRMFSYTAGPPYCLPHCLPPCHCFSCCSSWAGGGGGHKFKITPR